MLRLLVLALVSGGAVMVVEIAAPRLVAPHVGTGALAWTITIATFLAGIAIGNVVGGRLSDRVRSLLLPMLLVLSAGVCAVTPALHAVVAKHTIVLAHDARTLLSIPLAFLPVAFLLGTIPPVLARALLQRGEGPGLRLGLVAAAGAAGSVVGTFLAGFVLIPRWSLQWVFFGTAATLAVAAVLTPGLLGADVPAAPRRRERAAKGTFFGLAFLAGAAVLVVEIVAGRIASDRLGAGVYTWTSVIGVVLAGLSLGALVGGLLADRFGSRRLLPWALLGASIACSSLLWAHAILDLADTWVAEGRYDWPLACLRASALAFLAPALTLGTVSPIVIRAALAERAEDGRVVGGLYAAGTLGAVVGAVLAGGVLIPWAGLERLVLLLAFVLAAAGGALSGRRPYVWYGVLLLLAIGVQGPWETAREWARSLRLVERDLAYTVEDSRIQRVRVEPVEERWVRVTGGLDPVSVWTRPELEQRAMVDPFQSRLHWRGRMSLTQRAALWDLAQTDETYDAVSRLHALAGHDHLRMKLDRLVHGYVDLQDAAWLGYGYERIYAAVLPHVWPERSPVRCLFIGGGAYAFQRRLLARAGDDVRCVTLEIDPLVTAVARQELGLFDHPHHRIVHEDARTWIGAPTSSAEPFDVVFGDAFDDIAVPFHLTTREFAESLEARMAPDGVYLVNVVDSWHSGLFLGAFVNTLAEVFDDVRVVSASPRLVESRDTYVVIASKGRLSLDVEELKGEEGETVLVYAAEDVDDLRRRAGHRVLTDDHAPVETLLAPVLRAR